MKLTSAGTTFFWTPKKDEINSVSAQGLSDNMVVQLIMKIDVSLRRLDKLESILQGGFRMIFILVVLFFGVFMLVFIIVMMLKTKNNPACNVPRWR